MSDSNLLAASDLPKPFFGIEGLPDHLTHLSVQAEAGKLVLIRCEFYATEKQAEGIKQAFETLRREYVLIDRAELELLRTATDTAKAA